MIKVGVKLCRTLALQEQGLGPLIYRQSQTRGVSKQHFGQDRDLGDFTKVHQDGFL